MRALMRYLMAVLACLLLLACSQGQSAQTATEQDTEPGSEQEAASSQAEEVTGSLRWGIYADPARIDVAEQQVAMFSEQHPGITVEIEAVPFAQYYERLGAQVAAGTAYDVMMISGSYFPSIAPSGGLMDLTDLIERDGLDLTGYTTEEANSVHEGRTYALPYELDIQGLFYNKSMFDEAGVEYPDESWTWDDLRTAAEELTREAEGRRVWGFYAHNLYPSWVSFVGQAGGQLFDDSGTPQLNSPEVGDALEYLHGLMYADGVAPTPGEVPEGTNPFQAGLVAMAVDGSYSVLPTLQNVDFDWGVAQLPQGEERGAAYWTQGIAVNASTEAPEAAWEFAKFLMSPEGQAVLAETKFATPSLIELANDEQYLSGPPEGLDAFVEAYDYATPVAWSDNWFDLMSGPNSALGEPFTALWLDQISVQEAVERAQASAERVVGG